MRSLVKYLKVWWHALFIKKEAFNNAKTLHNVLNIDFELNECSWEDANIGIAAYFKLNKFNK